MTEDCLWGLGMDSEEELEEELEGDSLWQRLGFEVER